MFRKFFKKSMAVTLAAALFLAPTTSALAAENSFSTDNLLTSQYQLAPFKVPGQLSAQDSTYQKQSTEVSSVDDVKALAAQKAKLLTTLYGVTSVQYALIDNGVITVSGQAGSYSKDFVATPGQSTMYGIASISKMFTTAAVMNLVEDGKVELDKAVVNYIPDFTMADARYKDITVRMLLNHSSGLMGSSLGNALLLGDNDMSSYDNLLKTLSTQRLKAAPGAFSVYCNDGFSLAQLLVERVTGMSFSNYIAQTITTPLNMQDTSTPADTFNENKLAKVYYPGINTTLPTDNLNAIGAGGIYSTATDLCKFATVFMNNSSGILNVSSLIAMQNKEYLNGLWSQEDDSILAYGLGWDSVNTYPFSQYGIKALSKGGDSLFYHSNLTVLPDQNMAIAFVSSGGSSSFDQIAAQEILLAALKVKGTISEIKADKIVIMPAKTPVTSDIKQYAGYYNTMGSILKVDIADDGSLSLTDAYQGSASAQQFTYGGNGKFYIAAAGTSGYISFATEDNGKTYLYASIYSSLPGVGQTAVSLYEAQKIIANPITAEVKATWKKRTAKTYFLVNEKYSSEIYLAGLPYGSFQLLKGLDGYIGNATIVDANHAETRLEIPGNYGRDLADYTFYKQGDTEYFNANNNVYVSDDAVKNLSSKERFTCLIGSNGYAKYYKISAKTAGKVMSVKVPKNAAFMVYNKDGVYVNNSYISNKKKVTLPKNGYVVLVGDAGSKFTISCK